MEYNGYTYHLPAFLLPIWKRFLCSRNWHLWDEVLSDEHYLFCDACHTEIHLKNCRICGNKVGICLPKK